MRIGVLTGGGDCPGLNAVIRGIVRKGIEDGDHGFLGLGHGWAGVLFVVPFWLAMRSLHYFLSQYLNSVSDSAHRATVLSFKGLTMNLAYGMVNLPEGKMKSREGTVVDADDLIEEVTQLAREEISRRDAGVSGPDLDERARKIGLAALKFMMPGQ